MMKKSNSFACGKSQLLKVAAFALFAFFAPSVSFAATDAQAVQQQDGKVQGTVKDAAGEAIIGATIRVAGMQGGTITDIDGNFAIDAKAGQTLEVTAIGYKTQKVTVSGKSVAVVMEEDAQMLDEVVALGFGVQARKQDLSGSVGTLANPEKVQMRSLTSSTGMLQGQIPGVTISENSGDPTAGFNMVIRGQGSINDGVLWVVDGVPNAQIPAATEIESMVVLKDAASAAVYGATAANGGVIIVTTKGAKKNLNGVQIDYDGQVSIVNAINTIHGLSAQDYVAMRAQDDPGWMSDSYPQAMKDYINTQRTDWTDAIFRTAVRHRHTVAANFGNEFARNRVSFNYFDTEGTLKNTFDKGVNAHYKGDFDINKWVNISEDANWRHSRSRGANTSGVTDGVLINAIYAPPSAPMYNEDGTFSSWLPAQWQANTGMFGDIYNPLRLLEGDDNWNSWQEFQTNTALTIHDIIPGLKFTSRYTYVLSHNYYKNFHHYRYEITGRQESPTNANLSEGASTSYRWATENTLNYDNNFGDHNISLMLSTTADKRHGGYNNNVTGVGFSSEEKALQYMVYADNKQSSDGYGGMDTNVALVGRVGYSYADRYFFTASLRKDWAGRLVYEHNSGTFPAFTAAWKISSEKFWEPMKDKIQLLKLRANWGRVGNINSIGWLYSAYNLSTNNNQNERTQYGLGGAPVWGAQIYNDRAFNPALTWETSEQWGVGVDIATFNNRLSASLDYFNKRTYDLINTQTLNFPNYIGVSTPPTINSGEIKNKGVELTASWNDKIGSDFHYYLRGNLAWLQNEVSKTSEKDENGEWMEWTHGGSFRNLLDVYRSKAGGPYYQFYLIKTDGIFQTDAEAAAYVDKNGNRIQPQAKAGDLKFIDFNEDGQITDEDRQYCGSATPKWTYALSGGFDWKKLAVDFMFQGVGGAQIFYAGKTMIFNDNEGNFNRAEGIKDAWGWGKTTDAEIPRLSRSDDNGNFSKTSDYFLESGSYLRLKSLTVSYDLTDILRKINHFAERKSGLTAYITGENLFTITPYSGMDPECGGWDSIKYPVSRTISFGVKVTY